MSWKIEFAKGWAKLVFRQRYDRAKYVVDDGIKKKHGIREIADSIDVSQQTVRELIDLYAVSQGGARSTPPLSAGKMRIRAARDLVAKTYNIEPTQDEVDSYVDSTNADDDVARRMLRGQAVGDALRQENLVNVDGTLRVPDPRNQEVLAKLDRNLNVSSVPVNYDQWRKKFGEYATTCRAFITFLRRSKQDVMQDEAMAVQIQNITDGFQEQASRFDVGVAKSQARS